MKYLITIITCCFSAIHIQAQVSATENISAEQYDLLKAGGALNNQVLYSISLPEMAPSATSLIPESGSGPGCECYIPPDNTYIQAMPPNDDGSTGLINIPFSFCFYGVTYTGLWINNNGNITLDGPSGTFSSSGFPFSTGIAKKMIAPFWADVDTRPAGSGLVWYKITPTAIYINWHNVGYFNQQTDKLNTFQLILTDGSDAVIGIGNNIQFCYRDMEWTTGSASSGIGGFGGVPATVGVNEGDGVTFSQIGRFDAPGTQFFGPYQTNNQISWLDNQEFNFNVCNSANFPPIPVGLASRCDSIRLCEGDTFTQTITFLSPEPGQQTVCSASSGAPGFSQVGTTTGNTATVTYQIIASPANVGTHTITLTATDNGTPNATTTAEVYVNIILNNIAPPAITGNPQVCPGNQTPLDAGGGYDSYLWSNGANTQTANLGLGTWIVYATLDGCTKTDTVTVTSLSPFFPIIFGPLVACDSNESVTLSVPGPVTSWLWGNGSTQSTLTGPASLFINNVSVQITDTNQCISQSAPYSIAIDNQNVAISGILPFCAGDSILLSATPGFSSYLWSNGSTSQNTILSQGGLIQLTAITQNGCLRTDSAQATMNPLPEGSFSASTFCGNTEAFFTGNFSIASGTIAANQWTFGDGNTGNGNNPSHTYANPGLYPVMVTLTSDKGCLKTLVDSVRVNENPSASFTYEAGCFQKVTFNNESNGLNNPLITVWTTGDGSPTQVQANSFEYTYAQGGIYFVKIMVTDSFGCRDSLILPVDVPNEYTLPERLPNVLSFGSLIGNQHFNLEAFAPQFNQCINYRLHIMNRWGITVFETENNVSQPDLNCENCFRGFNSSGNRLSTGTYYYLLDGDNQARFQGIIQILE